MVDFVFEEGGRLRMAGGVDQALDSPLGRLVDLKPIKRLLTGARLC